MLPSPSHSPLEIYAHQLIRARLAEAANDALADQLPRAASSSRFPLAVLSPILSSSKAARQYLATTLRDLALRLDPSIVGCEPSGVVGRPR